MAKPALPASVKSRRQLVSIFHHSQYSIDGSTYAFSVLNIEDKGFEDLGEDLQNYEHIRELYLSKNKFSNIDKLRTLKYLQILEANSKSSNSALEGLLLVA